MKAALARLGIRGFKPELRRAPQCLVSLQTPGALPIPPNTLDEMRRDLDRLAVAGGAIFVMGLVRTPDSTTATAAGAP
jgi:transposase